MNAVFTIEVGVAQTRKAEIRERMLAAAEKVFAEAGYAGATMSQIAQEAGVATGNLYRYFASKDELFYAVFTDAFAESFLYIIRRRVRSLVNAEDLTELGPVPRNDAADLLAFLSQHRLKVVTLLDRAKGSRYEDFSERFMAALMKPTLAKLRREAQGRRLPPVVAFTLRRIFDNTVRTIVSILEQKESHAAIREAFELFWSYQLAGLAGLQRKVIA